MALPLWPKDGVRSTRVPPFPFAETRSGSEIDLREQMSLIIEGNDAWPRRGHWVLLRKMDHRQRCFCWNEKPEGSERENEDKGKYNEPKLRCPVCHGEGWIYEEQLQLTRRRLVAPEIGLAGAERMTDVGWMNINYIIFYFQYFVDINKADQIIELALDDEGKPLIPYQRKEMYRIAVVEPFRDLNGRVEYWRAAAKLEVV